jgi:hypothetical protein
MSAVNNAGDLNSHTSAYNAVEFVVQQVLAKVNTVALVKIKSVTNSGGLTAAGVVSVQPLVNAVDGAGVATTHGIINNLIYLRVQGGTNAIIMDPAAGDIGIALFCQRDITAVRATKAQANPGSFRRFDWADGIYIGGVLNGVPSQYVQFNASGITIVSPTEITLQAPMIMLTGNVGSTGTLMNNGKNVGSTHEHSGVMTGGGDTGPPI